jgi:stage IV sporulation protein B
MSVPPAVLKKQGGLTDISAFIFSRGAHNETCENNSRGRKKMKKAIVTGLWSLALLGGLTLPAYAQELLVGGQAVGIQISTEGVLVAGLCPVETAEGTLCPAEDAGIREGDLIVRAGGREIPDAAALVAAVENAAGPIALGLRRGTQELTLGVAPAAGEDGRPMLGILLRDGLAGCRIEGVRRVYACGNRHGLFETRI